VVTNAVAFGLERAPQIAKDVGFEHVVAKLWWQNDELLATEKANLDAAVDAVDAVCVGNEIIQKGIADHDQLVREVDEAGERWGGRSPPGSSRRTGWSTRTWQQRSATSRS
jgi:exo-beta-1,3-glucanase (GH17 family)